MKAEEALVLMSQQMPPDKCWGIRMDQNNLITAFYHPWGCESEMTWESNSGKTLSSFISEVKKDIDLDD